MHHGEKVKQFTRAIVTCSSRPEKKIQQRGDHDHKHFVIKKVFNLQQEEGLLSTLRLDDDEEEGVYLQNTSESILTQKFTRTFIKVMKMMKSELSSEAIDMLLVEYAYLRALDSERGIDSANVLSLTARAMETLICLATAHAKCRTSRSVEQGDAEAAIRLMRFAHFGMEGSPDQW